MAERLLLIDSNSLIYRGYFAIPPLTTTKGELVTWVETDQLDDTARGAGGFGSSGR